MSDSLKDYLEATLQRMLNTAIVTRRTHMVVVGRTDMELPEAYHLLGKRLLVIRDDRIPVERNGELNYSTVYIMRRTDYTWIKNHAD